ncbi:hypothetical protein LWF15_13930 [Kineosporia rhizophila]|uniref:hypothetical protein n=1 Tax=Kineosporia rhizophila TaxID=84633 RepID=UPI001E5AB56B|nr:hypothetical protein [Kineosporia rhizophila]MCE0536607.1 hypothetical protein [Kineosporia rhizophila]
MSLRYSPDPGDLGKALAARLDKLERAHAETHTDVQALGRGLNDLASAVRSGSATTGTTSGAASQNEEEQAAQPDWFARDLTAELACEMVTVLRAQTEVVLAHYGIELAPPCWVLHPTVVADLLALVCERQTAYADERPTRVSEWVNRWQPAAAERVTTALNPCRQDRAHHDRDGRLWDVGDLDPLSAATWWATDRNTPAPDAFAFAPA